MFASLSIWDHGEKKLLIKIGSIAVRLTKVHANSSGRVTFLLSENNVYMTIYIYTTIRQIIIIQAPKVRWYFRCTLLSLNASAGNKSLYNTISILKSLQKLKTPLVHRHNGVGKLELSRSIILTRIQIETSNETFGLTLFGAIIHDLTSAARFSRVYSAATVVLQ